MTGICSHFHGSVLQFGIHDTVVRGGSFIFIRVLCTSWPWLRQCCFLGSSQCADPLWLWGSRCWGRAGRGGQQCWYCSLGQFHTAGSGCTPGACWQWGDGDCGWASHRIAPQTVLKSTFLLPFPSSIVLHVLFSDITEMTTKMLLGLYHLTSPHQHGLSPSWIRHYLSCFVQCFNSQFLF